MLLSNKLLKFDGRILGSPKIHVRCGWKDDKFGKLSSIKSRVKDVIVLHNFYKPMRSSCGGISWQVFNPTCGGLEIYVKHP